MDMCAIQGFKSSIHNQFIFQILKMQILLSGSFPGFKFNFQGGLVFLICSTRNPLSHCIVH